MRDLAASFSTRRSPNHQRRTTTTTKELSASVQSPRKYNPFAREGTSAASPPRRKGEVTEINSLGIVGTTKRTTVDLEPLLGRTGGAGNKLGATKEDEDEEMLGESPVKVDSRMASKSFVSLFDQDDDDDEEPKEQGEMKNPFLAEGTGTKHAKTKGNGKKGEQEVGGKKDGMMNGWLRKAVHPTLKGVKRTGYHGAEQVEEEVEEEDPESGDEHRSTITSGPKGKKKAKRAPAELRYKKLPGGKGNDKNRKGSAMQVDSQNEEDDNDDDDDMAASRIGKTSKVGSTLIIDLEDEDQHRIVIRSTGEGIGPKRREEEAEEADLIDATGSLIYVRETPRPPPSSSIPTTSLMDEDATTTIYDHDDNEALPQDLASILSLRSSPMKKTASKRMLQRDRTVDELLKGPSSGKNRVKKGLMDLEDDDEAVREGVESDDDWISDVEGWKAVSDGEMDGYEEVEGMGRM
ncbi:BQ2448_3140 [Microbotryum intermedium]|uniref:BQ2448_3140 protein n=1 Tax=Microbotryum intermedium TaxID=269621 RepID=A0A238FCJ0_9BASI|nr:BQ2448_3140 [Microbotryum intermedium]